MQPVHSPVTSPLHLAIALAGGPAGLAAKVNELRPVDSVPVRSQHVVNWRRRGRVPADWCLLIEAAVDGQVTRYQLRADVFGAAPAPRAESQPDVVGPPVDKAA
jgi:DNA-binding transcriptional regulator YdaS (Cro superfamily)